MKILEKGKFITICLFLLMMIAWIPKSHVYAYEPENGGGYSAVLYNSNNGLPTSEANVVTQTSDGFIWIGCYSGLVRYDGNTFYRYDASTGITSVTSMYVDSRDRLWIGTNDSGVALYEAGVFLFYGKEQGLQSSSVKAIAEDGAGNIIIGTTEGVSYIDEKDELHTLEDDRVRNAYICEVKRDAYGRVYGVTIDGNAFLIENLEVTYFYECSSGNYGAVTCICPDQKEDGIVYIGTEGSLLVRGNLLQNMKDGKEISAAPQSYINDICQTEEGTLWICADNGIGYLDEEDHYTELKNVPMNNSVDEMMSDYEGNLWFASSRQGVMKISENRFYNISVAAGLDSMVINTTYMFNGRLYLGTDNGLFILDRNYHVVENDITRMLEGVRVRCVKEDSRGRLWICTYSEYGLICCEKDGSFTNYNEENGINSNRVRTMMEMSDGTIVVASGGGVNFIRNQQVVASYREDVGIRNTEILSLCEGEDGKLYIGSDGDGLYILEGESVRKIGQDEGLKSEVILRIKKDPKREGYWIVTGNSIAYMVNEQVSTITNFPYSNNLDMFFDENDRIWILSSNGIYVADGDKLVANEELDYIFYNIDSGLPCAITANTRNYIDENGELYLSGSSYVSSININQSDILLSQIKLSVPYIEIDDTMVYLDGKSTITIPHDCKRLTIYGYALTYALQDPQISYYLEGFDEDIVQISKKEFAPVSYTNLGAGEYVFHLAIVDQVSGEIENETTITIIKEKAIYEHVWFRVIVVSAVALLFLSVTMLYTNKKTAHLIEKQKESAIFVDQIIRAFATSIDKKDHYTNGHSFRVAKYARLIAQRLGYSKEKVEEIYNIAMLHDIGKIVIPTDILNKPGRLTEEEFATIKQHAQYGYEILNEIESFPELALGARYHHERIDGHGYPTGKSGEDIPYIARIIAVADTFDAMNSTRSYRAQMPMEEIVAELKRVSGTQLEPEIVNVLLQLIEEGAV